MDSGSDSVEIAGELIAVGTSLYHVRTNEVVWYRGTRDGRVRLHSVDDSFALTRSDFESLVSRGDLVVESLPPGHPRP